MTVVNGIDVGNDPTIVTVPDPPTFTHCARPDFDVVKLLWEGLFDNYTVTRFYTDSQGTEHRENFPNRPLPTQDDPFVDLSAPDVNCRYIVSAVYNGVAYSSESLRVPKYVPRPIPRIKPSTGGSAMWTFVRYAGSSWRTVRSRPWLSIIVLTLFVTTVLAVVFRDKIMKIGLGSENKIDQLLTEMKEVKNLKVDLATRPSREEFSKVQDDVVSVNNRVDGINRSLSTRPSVTEARVGEIVDNALAARPTLDKAAVGTIVDDKLSTFRTEVLATAAGATRPPPALAPVAHSAPAPAATQPVYKPLPDVFAPQERTIYSPGPNKDGYRYVFYKIPGIAKPMHRKTAGSVKIRKPAQMVSVRVMQDATGFWRQESLNTQLLSGAFKTSYESLPHGGIKLEVTPTGAGLLAPEQGGVLRIIQAEPQTDGSDPDLKGTPFEYDLGTTGWYLVKNEISPAIQQQMNELAGLVEVKPPPAPQDSSASDAATKPATQPADTRPSDPPADERTPYVRGGLRMD